MASAAKSSVSFGIFGRSILNIKFLIIVSYVFIFFNAYITLSAFYAYNGIFRRSNLAVNRNPQNLKYPPTSIIQTTFANFESFLKVFCILL